jgi:hypothetical protein
VGQEEQPQTQRTDSGGRAGRPPLRARAGRAAGGVARALTGGVPGAFVAALAAFVLVAILFTIASREPKELRGYAEFTMTEAGCTVEPRQQLNAAECTRISPGTYRVRFTKSLTGSTVLASRGSCCPGQIAASIQSDTEVLVVVQRRLRAPVRATLLVP